MTSPGIEQIGAIVLEDTFDTHKAFTTDNGIGFISAKITPKLDWQAYKEHVGSASLQGEHKGKQGCDFEIEGYIKPNGVGVPPDCAPIIEAAHFELDGNDYVLRTDAPSSLQFARKVGSKLFEAINGLFIGQLELEAAGNMPGMFRARGSAASYGALLGTPVTGASTYLAGVTSIALSAASAYKVRPGVRVAFGAENNAGAGYLITALSTNGQTMTFTPALANNIGAGVAVTPVLPAVAPEGTIVGGIADGLSIDSTAVGFISHKVTIETGIHGLDKEATANRINRLSRGARSVTTESQFYFLDETAHVLGAAWNGTTRELVARIGENTAGLRFTITTPAARIGVAEIEVPEADEATYSANGVCRRDAANEDEIKLTID